MAKFDDLLESARLEWDHRKQRDAGTAGSGLRGLNLADFVQLPQVNVKELIATAPRKKVDEFTHLLNQRLEKLVADGAYTGPSLTPAGTTAVNYLTVLMEMCSELIDASDPTRLISPELPQLVQSLHDMMFDLEAPEGIKVQGYISRLCETWFVKNFPNRENVVPQMLSYLLVMCSDNSQGKVAYLKRLWQVRQAFRALDLDDPESAYFRDHLLRAYVSPLFLRHVDGRKLLSFFFSLSASMVQSAHQVIKGQLPHCRASLIEVYADVYFRAWRDLVVGTTSASAAIPASAPEASSTALHDAQIQVIIETTCIQDLMDLAIYTRNPATARVVQSILRLGFHKNKIQHKPYVDSLLYRLYTPIIWRALKAQNAAVRRNAVSLFVDAFPLSNPDGPAHETETLLQNQFQQLITLLEDPDIAVRARATEGIAHVLKEWWELLPTHVVRTLLTKLITELAFDASSVAVRAAVLDGLAEVLDNPLSHSVLKIMLPKLAPLIHDRSERVQSAMLNLLLTVKRLRTIKFFEIVEVDDIILRLAECTTPIASKITELLLNSFFPQGKPPAETLHRALTFMKKNAAAARAFFERVHALVPAKQVLNLVYLLYRFLLQHVNNVLGIASSSSPDTNVVSSDQDLSVSKPFAIQVLVLMVQMWESVRTYRTEPELQTFMASAFKDRGLERILQVYGDNPTARVAIMAMSANLPLECSPQLAEAGLAHLTRIPDNSPDVEFAPLVNCLFAWKQHGHALRLVYEGMCSGFDVNSARAQPQASSTSARGKQSKRGVSKGSSNESPEDTAIGNKLSPILAFRFYSHLWADTRIRTMLLSRQQACAKLESLADIALRELADEFDPAVIQRRVGVTHVTADSIIDDLDPSTGRPAQLERETMPDGSPLSFVESSATDDQARSRAQAISQRLRILLSSLEAFMKSAIHQLSFATARREEQLQPHDTQALELEALVAEKRARRLSSASVRDEFDDEVDAEANDDDDDDTQEDSRVIRERVEKYRVSQIVEAEHLIRRMLQRIFTIAKLVTERALPLCHWLEFYDESKEAEPKDVLTEAETGKKARKTSSKAQAASESNSAKNVNQANAMFNPMNASVSKRDLATCVTLFASKIFTEIPTLGLVPANYISPFFEKWADHLTALCDEAKKQIASAKPTSPFRGLKVRLLPGIEDTFYHALVKGVLQMGSSSGSACPRVAALAAESMAAAQPSKPELGLPSLEEETAFIEEQAREAVKHMCVVSNSTLALTRSAFTTVPAVLRVGLLETLRLLSGSRTSIITITALLLQHSAAQLLATEDELVRKNLPALGAITAGVQRAVDENEDRAPSSNSAKRGGKRRGGSHHGSDDEAEESEEEDVHTKKSNSNAAEARRRASMDAVPSERSKILLPLPELADFLIHSVAKTPLAAFATPEAVVSLLSAPYREKDLPEEDWSAEDAALLAKALQENENSQEAEELKQRLNAARAKAETVRSWALLHLLAHLCHNSLSLVRTQSHLRRVTHAIATAAHSCYEHLRTKASAEIRARNSLMLKSAEGLAEDLKYAADVQ